MDDVVVAPAMPIQPSSAILTDYMASPIEEFMTIRTYPDPILQKTCEPITEEEFGPGLFALGEEMIGVVRKRNAYGIAGPQVGLLKMIFVMDAEEYGPVIICNPDIELIGTDRDYQDEGCLSLPGVSGQVARPTNILMRFRTPMGAKVSIKLSGLNARIAQHENDHLYGTMFFDRMSRNLRRHMMRGYPQKSST